MHGQGKLQVASHFATSRCSFCLGSVLSVDRFFYVRLRFTPLRMFNQVDLDLDLDLVV